MSELTSERNIEATLLIDRANAMEEEFQMNQDLLLSAAAIVQRLDTLNLMIQLVVNELRRR